MKPPRTQSTQRPQRIGEAPPPHGPKSPSALSAFSAVVFWLWCVPATVHAQTAITLTPGLAAQGIAISDEFSGLSFETQLLLPTDGVRYFRADNLPLVHLFKTLGIKHLRIGGNTADNPAIAIPGDADIDSLFGFAKAADVKVVYTIRLRPRHSDRQIHHREICRQSRLLCTGQ